MPLSFSTRDRAMSTFPEALVHNNLFRRQASVTLDIVVVGAGLSGLSAAYNLRQAGHNVRVLEKMNGPPELYSGLRVPSNMSKLLQYWGLSERLKSKAVRCPQIEFLDGTNGMHLNTLLYHPALMKELEAEMYGMNFRDLYDMVLDAAMAAGAQVEFGSEVLDVDESIPSVTLANGRTIMADLIVGADGVHSIVRTKAFDDAPLKYGPFSNFSFLVPVSEMLKDPLLSPLLEDGTWRLWLGANTVAVNYKVSAEYYHVSITYAHEVGRGKDCWSMTCPPADVDVSQFEERISRLMVLGKNIVPSQHIFPPKLEDWCSESGTVVLVGDAVHPDNPECSSGPALNLEDGCVLGSLFSRLQTRDRSEIFRLLGAYQEIRQERCEHGVQSDFEIVAIFSLPPGPDCDKRNEGFKQSEANKSLDWEDEEGEESLRGTWEQYRMQLAYEAYDAADDWWVDWGVMAHRMAAASTPTEETTGNDGHNLFNFSAIQTTSVINEA